MEIMDFLWNNNRQVTFPFNSVNLYNLREEQIYRHAKERLRAFVVQIVPEDLGYCLGSRISRVNPVHPVGISLSFRISNIIGSEKTSKETAISGLSWWLYSLSHGLIFSSISRLQARPRFRILMILVRKMKVRWPAPPLLSLILNFELRIYAHPYWRRCRFVFLLRQNTEAKLSRGSM